MLTLMTNTTASTTAPADSSAEGELAMDDPRMGFAGVTRVVADLMDGVSDDQLDDATPCDDFSVKDLLDHLVLVMQRVAVIGDGKHFSEASEETANRDSGHADAFRAAAGDVHRAWTDDAMLEQPFEVPWGELPGAPVLLTYTSELATHGWDLAQATGQDLSIDDALLGGALMAARMLPADERDPAFFGPVVDPGADAPALLQIAGWFGRKVA